jgi:hypothetical protein
MAVAAAILGGGLGAALVAGVIQFRRRRGTV